MITREDYTKAHSKIVANGDGFDVFIDGGHFEAPLSALEHLMALCNGDWIQRRELIDATETLFDMLCETGALTDEDNT